MLRRNFLSLVAAVPGLAFLRPEKPNKEARGEWLRKTPRKRTIVQELDVPPRPGLDKMRPFGCGVEIDWLWVTWKHGVPRPKVSLRWKYTDEEKWRVEMRRTSEFHTGPIHVTCGQHYLHVACSADYARMGRLAAWSRAHSDESIGVLGQVPMAVGVPIEFSCRWRRSQTRQDEYFPQ